MEIGPIPGIRALPAAKPRPVDPELTAFFDVEAAAKPGDDTYTGNEEKAAGAEENDENESEESEEISASEEPSNNLRDQTSAGQISFFA